MKSSRRPRPQPPKTVAASDDALALLSEVPARFSTPVRLVRNAMLSRRRMLQIRADYLLILRANSPTSLSSKSSLQLSDVIFVEKLPPRPAPSFSSSISLPSVFPNHRLSFSSPNVLFTFLSFLPPSSSPLTSSSSSTYSSFTNVQLESLPLLGRGASADVRLLPSGHAVKLLPKVDIFDSHDSLRQAIHERLALQRLRNIPYIVHLHAAFQTQKYLALVTDVAAFGDLHSILANVITTGKLPVHHAREIFAQIVLALTGVHNAGFLYRDMKLANVLITQSGRVRLADFGLVKPVGNGIVNGKKQQQQQRNTASELFNMEYSSTNDMKTNKKSWKYAQRQVSEFRNNTSPQSILVEQGENINNHNKRQMRCVSDFSSSYSSESSYPDSYFYDEEPDTTQEEDNIEQVTNENKVMYMGRASSFVGTRRYMSPELCVTAKKRSYGTPSDVWALGIVLFNLLTGQYPFSPGDDDATTMFLAICNDDVNIPDYVDEHAKDLLLGLLNRDPLERLDLLAIRKHPWLSDINWKRLSRSANKPNWDLVQFLIDKGAKLNVERNNEEEKENKKEKHETETSFEHLLGYDYVL